MKLDKIKEILDLGENQYVEFKSTTNSTDSIGSAVCAFLNCDGGVIAYGIGGDLEIIGIPDAGSKKRILEKTLIENISPSALFSLEVYPVDDKDLILIEVPAGKDIPFAYKDKIYIKSNSKIKKAGAEAIREMVFSNSTESERWERRISSNLSDVDLDHDEIKRCVGEIEKQHPMRFQDSSDVEGVLSEMSLARYGQVTNAGHLFFSKNPTLSLPQARVRATCFTDETSDRFTDNRIFEGPLVQVYNKTLTFILQNIRRRSLFPGDKTVREDSHLYPISTVREGLINAFAHRDYADYSGGITVNIYPGSLEIRNSGSFPEGITPDNISCGHFMILRNPDIAHTMYLLSLMEKIGRGARMIVKDCEEYGLEEPIWESDPIKGVTLTLATMKKLKKALSQHQVEILRKCIAPSKITVLMGRVGRIDRTKFRNQILNPLLEQGLVEMTIPDKPKSSRQQYKLTSRGLNTLETLEK